jgi:glyoxylase-like metal-dependent hydrolase (beta-lactamase superfamily II)
MMPTPEWTGPFHRRLGGSELTVVTDRTYTLDGGAFFGVVPKPMWSKLANADEQNRVRTGLNALLVRHNGTLSLIETGCGDKLSEKQMTNWGVDRRRDFLQRLQASGFPPASIDLVVNTHLHFDHCGWNTVRGSQGQLLAAFPKARYFVQRQEVEHAREQHERDRVSYLADNYEPLIASGQMELVEGRRELLPGIELVPLPGHTRGLQGVLIHSGAETACYVSDLIPTRWHIKPTWVLGFDLFPLETIENKHRILDQAARERWLMVFTHDPEWPWGYVEKSGNDYRVVAAREPEVPLPK